jgi:hypothetical protein
MMASHVSAIGVGHSQNEVRIVAPVIKEDIVFVEPAPSRVFVIAFASYLPALQKSKFIGNS